MGHEYNAFMNKKVGGRPPYDPPPDGKTELKYLDEMIPDTYWMCFVFASQKQIDRLRKIVIELNGNMDIEVIKPVGDAWFLVRIPRYLTQQINLKNRIETDGETAWQIKSIRRKLLPPATE